ncbi:hypothetical protein N7468_006433 [Penicillium chermesinum]|uniref:Uncharacterized protein n=1 Tax=Penicillium chermesinum TaxID=63820 RepID=A0A9W9NSN2_9EURO|nr:uncharacterized protein N7468_006433 [Penicillium chermesinum]KAJ5225208.1 hypothetical protein N7468_006433 [Penicillium chermesinum]
MIGEPESAGESRRSVEQGEKERGAHRPRSDTSTGQYVLQPGNTLLEANHKRLLFGAPAALSMFEATLLCFRGKGYSTPLPLISGCFGKVEWFQD